MPAGNRLPPPFAFESASPSGIGEFLRMVGGVWSLRALRRRAEPVEALSKRELHHLQEIHITTNTPPATIRVPSISNAHERIAPSPKKLPTSRPVENSQTFNGSSQDADTTYRPSGLTLTSFTHPRRHRESVSDNGFSLSRSTPVPPTDSAAAVSGDPQSPL